MSWSLSCGANTQRCLVIGNHCIWRRDLYLTCPAPWIAMIAKHRDFSGYRQAENRLWPHGSQTPEIWILCHSALAGVHYFLNICSVISILNLRYHKCQHVKTEICIVDTLIEFKCYFNTLVTGRRKKYSCLQELGGKYCNPLLMFSLQKLWLSPAGVWSQQWGIWQCVGRFD